MIVTEWVQFRALDLDRIKAAMAQPIVVDLRNIYRADDMAAKITKGSGGAVKAERLYMTNEQEMVAQLMRGRLELGALSNIATTRKPRCAKPR